VLGGVAWFGKAAAILATGEQPPLLFEFAPMLFGFGLLGLRLRLTPSRSWLTRTGGWFAAVALILSGGDLALGAAEEGAFSSLTLATSLAVLAALILLGVPTRRRAALPGVARVLPLTLGVATFPLLAVGGALEVIDERLLEVPFLLLAAGWIWLGAALWRAAAVTNHTRGKAEGGGATRRRPRPEPGRSRF
jgi:hypothetical protein